MRLRRLLSPTLLAQNRARFVCYLDEQRGQLINNLRLRNLRNRHQGERCFIIGNGPSLTMNDLDKLEREVSFAANKIFLAFDNTRWRPRYYVVEDDNMIQQHYQQILRIRGSVKFVNDRWKVLFRGDREVVWYPWRSLSDDEFPKFSGNPLETVYCGYMVTYIGLQLAYFLGFSRVYLVGVDFNYSLIYRGQNSIEHSADHPHDHFTADYFKPGETRYLPQLDRAERAMRCAKNFYEAHGRRIWNATRGGRLEVFDRISLDEALAD
jgi:hypothetical protein